MSASDLGPEYDDEPRENADDGSGEESDEDGEPDNQSDDESDADKPKKLKRVLHDNGDGTSTVTWVPVPENEFPGFFGRLFGRASSHDGAGAEQSNSEAIQDDGRANEQADERQSDIFDRLFGRVDRDDGYDENDPEVLRRTRLWQNVDDRLEDFSRMYIG